MIEDTLNGAKSTRYKHAARHLLECASLAPGIQDFGGSKRTKASLAVCAPSTAERPASGVRSPRRWEATGADPPGQI